jgi:hypothetical protein
MWGLSFTVFLTAMKSSYRRSFLSREKGFQWVQSIFLEGRTDADKAGIFTCNSKLWKAIRGSVEKWVRASWWAWKQEEPDWFDDNVIACIPDDFVPPEEDRVLLRDIRRKSSLMMGIGDGGQEERAARGD